MKTNKLVLDLYINNIKIYNFYIFNIYIYIYIYIYII